MSEPARTPGNRNSPPVPPVTPRASTIAYDMPGACICSRQAAPIPDRPAPTIRASTCPGPAAGSTARAGVAFILLPVLLHRQRRHEGIGQPNYAALSTDVSQDDGGS